MIDPVTLSTVWHSFQTCSREMRLSMERTAQSYLMAQLKDISAGVWLADGSTVAIPIGIPSQFLGTGFALRSIREQFGDDLHPGDVILTNDPYHGGHNCHLPDWGFIRPIFYEDELLFFAMMRGHQMDTGGSFPGGYFPNGLDIHAEGLCIPPIKVIDRGQERSDVLGLIWNNVRFSAEVRLDNYAMIASTALAEDRIVELLDRYGRDTVLGCIDEMIERTETAVRAEIAEMPDGTYTGESATDDDGTVLDEQVWVRVDVTVDGDELTLDFSRSDAQRRGFINAVYAVTYSLAFGATLLTFDSALADYHNEGSCRPITVIAPEGSVCNAQYPATVGASPVSMGTQIMEAVLEALAKARPARAVAAWGKHRGDYTSAVDPRTGRDYVRTTFDYDGSVGAVWGHDGPTGPGGGLSTLGAVRRGNVEEQEVRFPWRILKLEALTDFMGAGRWRGGGGVEWRALNEGTAGRMATGSSDGDEVLGKGAAGGSVTPECRTMLKRGETLTRIKPHRMQPIEPGDEVIRLSSGGGGVGDPREREIEKVVTDVRAGMVSPEAARSIYGVALDPETLQVDGAETQRLRSLADPPRVEVLVDEERLSPMLRVTQP